MAWPWLRRLLDAIRVRPPVVAEPLTILPPTEPKYLPLARNEDARLVYADMLEEQGRLVELEWLRVEQSLWEGTGDSDEQRSSLAALQVPLQFKAAVAREVVENCGTTCRSTWDVLTLSERPDLRRCDVCNADVWFVDTLTQAQHLMAKGSRFVVSPEVEYYDHWLRRLPWPLFVEKHPVWSDAGMACVPYRQPVSRAAVPPLLNPWSDELALSPVSVKLKLMKPPPPSWEPTPASSFARGSVAFLEQPTWPTCERCARELELCLHLAPEAMEAWLPGNRGLVLMYCFACREESATAFVQLVRPLHRVCRVDDSSSREWHGGTPPGQVPVEFGQPVRLLPNAVWLRQRSYRSPSTAASVLLGADECPVDGPFPDGFSQAMFEPPAIETLLDSWAGNDFLGGLPKWDQDERAPHCSHGEMQHLLDFNGELFLDGAIHVFVCRERLCEGLQWVAEF